VETEKEIIANLVKAIEAFGWADIVSGDALLRTNPESKMRLNSSESWMVSGAEKSAHKLRAKRIALSVAVEKAKEVLK